MACAKLAEYEMGMGSVAASSSKHSDQIGGGAVAIGATEPGAHPRGGIQEEAARLRKDVDAARDEATRAKEIEGIANMQVKQLSQRQAGYEDECAALREALFQLQQASDQAVDAGQLQWQLVQSRRSEGEARRKEAAALARQRHLQANLLRLQLFSEDYDTTLDQARARLRELEAAHTRANSAKAQLEGGSNSLPVILQLREQVRDAAAQAEETHRAATLLKTKHEATLTELAAYSARDDDQRALLNAIASAAQKNQHAQLLTATDLAVGAGESSPPLDGTAPRGEKILTNAEVVSLISLSSAKTELKVSELRLKRKLAALELSELNAQAAARESEAKRCELEGELVRAQEERELAVQQSAAREDALQAQITSLRNVDAGTGTGASADSSVAPPASCHGGVAGHAALGNTNATPESGGEAAVETPVRRIPVSSSSKRHISAEPRSAHLASSREAAPYDSPKRLELELRGSPLAAQEAHARFTSAGGVESNETRTEIIATPPHRGERQGDLETENHLLRSQLSSVRKELAAAEDALARTESHYELKMAQRLPGSLRESRDHGSTPGSPLGVSIGADGMASSASADMDARVRELVIERAELEQRHTAKMALAEESLRSMQAQMRRKDGELRQVGELLAEAREASRRDKASMAADRERNAEQVDVQNEALIRHNMASLEKLCDDAAAAPGVQGASLTLRQIEEEGERKEATISQLQAELSAAKSELGISNAHLEQRLVELSTLNAQIAAETGRQPTDQITQRVSQVRSMNPSPISVSQKLTHLPLSLALRSCKPWSKVRRRKSSSCAKRSPC